MFDELAARIFVPTMAGRVSVARRDVARSPLQQPLRLARIDRLRCAADELELEQMDILVRKHDRISAAHLQPDGLTVRERARAFGPPVGRELRTQQRAECALGLIAAGGEEDEGWSANERVRRGNVAGDGDGFAPQFGVGLCADLAGDHEELRLRPGLIPNRVLAQLKREQVARPGGGVSAFAVGRAPAAAADVLRRVPAGD